MGDLTLGIDMGRLDKYGLWDLDGFRRKGFMVNGWGVRDIDGERMGRGGVPRGTGMLIGVAGAL